MSAVLVVLAVVVAWRLIRRRNRARMVAGLVAERPGFFIEPPGGRFTKRGESPL